MWRGWEGRGARPGIQEERVKQEGAGEARGRGRGATWMVDPTLRYLSEQQDYTGHVALRFI